MPSSTLTPPTVTAIPPTVVPIPHAAAPSLPTVCKTAGYCPLTDCRKDECLFISNVDPFSPVGLATLRGYYIEVERTGFVDDTWLCNAFVVVDGTQELIRSYVADIDAGNGVNTKNGLNQPIINIEMKGMDLADRDKILSSTQDQLVQLLIVSPIPTGMGAPPCYSSVQIVKVD